MSETPEKNQPTVDANDNVSESELWKDYIAGWEEIKRSHETNMSSLLEDNDFNEIEDFEHSMENAEQVDEGESMDTPVDEAKVLDPPNNESTQAASNHTTRNPVSEPSGSKPTLVNKNLNSITHNLAPERSRQHIIISLGACRNQLRQIPTMI